MPKVTAYAAFLRGINVGGNNKIAMTDLKKAFEDLGFQKVKTLLASGNVLFETTEPAKGLKQRIEEAIEKTFQIRLHVLLRSITDLQKLDSQAPFQGINVTPQTRLYVTFLEEKPNSKLPLPYTSPEQDFQILLLVDNTLISVLTLSPTTRSVDGMKVLEKAFGKHITTRNWNTVQRILQLHKKGVAS